MWVRDVSMKAKETTQHTNNHFERGMASWRFGERLPGVGKRREEKRREEGYEMTREAGKNIKTLVKQSCSTVPGSFQQLLLGFGICLVASRQDALIDCNSQVVIAVFIAVLELPDVLVCFGVAVVVPDDVINMLSLEAQQHK